MGEGEAWKLVLPKEKRAEALYEGHDELTSGHLGSRKTYLRIAALYFWPNMQKDVNEYVKSCFICQQCKVEQLAPDNLRRREEEEGNENLDLEAKEEWKNHLNKLHDHYAVINKRIAIAQDRQAKYFNEKHREVEFKVGDKVWLKNRVQSSAPNNIVAKLARHLPSQRKFLRPVIQPIDETEETDSENEIQVTSSEAQADDAADEHANTNEEGVNEAETHDAMSGQANNEKPSKVGEKAQTYEAAHEHIEPHESTGNEVRACDMKAKSTGPCSEKDSKTIGRKKPMTTQRSERNTVEKHTDSPDEQKELSDVSENEIQTPRRTTRAAARRREQPHATNARANGGAPSAQSL
ncbi:hypothetical protein TKK_0001617 [Trichogramma kaykai]